MQPLRYALYISAFLIVYGSLYPFDFAYNAFSDRNINGLTDFAFWRASLSDLLGNILLFVPFGLFLSLLNDKKTGKTFVQTCAIGFALAYGVQLAQLFVESRLPYGGDAIWNLFGVILGTSVSQVYDKTLSSKLVAFKQDDKVTLLLVLALFVLLLQPFVPTLDWGLIKDNIKSVLFFSQFDLGQMAKFALIYLAIWTLISTVTGLSISVFGIVFLFAIATGAQFFIVNNAPSVSKVFAPIIAIAYISLIGKNVSTKTNVWLLLGLFAMSMLLPLEFKQTPSQINWVPFSASLTGSMLVNTSALISKLIMFFGLVWLLVRCGFKTTFVILWLSASVFAVEISHMWLSNRSSDITDVLLCVVAGWFVSQLHSQIPRETTANNNTANPLINENIPAHTSSLWHSYSFSVGQFTPLLILLFVLSAGQYTVMSLPGLPYNLAGLYGESPGLFNYIFFSMAVLLFGFGGVWVSRLLLTEKLGIHKAALLCLGLGMLTYLLLLVAVTRESLADINGYHNFVYQVTGELIFGQLGADIIHFFGAESVTSVTRVIEPIIRFGALVGPILLTVMWSVTSLMWLSHARNTGNQNRWARDTLVALIHLIPWFFICKVVTFDYSSTDNLNELIARDGEFGLGGGGYLYLLMVFMVFVPVFTAWSFHVRLTKAKFVSVCCLFLVIPVNWALLNAGLEQSVAKYGYTFSGVDFLIGGSRKTLLDTNTLFMRWVAVNLVANFALFGVLRLGLSILMPRAIPTYADLTTKPAPNESQSVPNIVKKAVSASMPHIQRKWIFGCIALICAILSMSYSLRDETNSQGIMVPWSAQPASIIFDPHMHTRYSDGNLSVEELVKLASTNKCNAIAITDHADTQGTFVQQRSNDIATARENYPEMFIFKGIELNPPSYQGREHINLFGTPDVEDSLIARVQPAQSKDAMANKNDSALLNALATLDSEQVVAIYNHPSRKDLRREENLFDYEKWSAESDVFIGFEGAPGHQKSPTVGSYKSLFKTIYRWDPVVSTPNGTWDKLLDKGRQVWAALASSDFHNSDLDYPPCDFARVHLRVPEYSYSGIIQALRTGTFWADHGKLLEKFDFSIFLNDTQTTVFPGEISQNVARYSTALMQFDLRRFEDKVGLPLMLDVYTNCTEGNPQRYEMGTLDAYSSYAEFALPLQMTGADKRTCFVRARVSLQNSEFGPVYAYSNPIRITLD